MILLLKLALLICLIAIVYQDFRYKAVSIILLSITSIFLIACGQISEKITWEEIAVNLAFISILLISIKVYFLIKYHSFRMKISEGIGAADIIMFFAFACCLQPMIFNLVLISAFISALLSSRFIASIRERIPLAAFMSLSLIIFNFIQYIL